MKPLGLVTPVFVTLLVLSSPALANISLTPSSITLSGTRKGTQTREIIIQTDSSIEKIELISTDLKNTDGSTVFPAKLIQFEPIKNQPSPWLRYRVKFNLEDQIHSGEYTGNILLKYKDQKQEIPVTLRLKDSWLRVLPVLLLGVGIGVGLSTYRTERLTHDEILVSVGRLRTQMRADSELIQPFGDRILGLLEMVDDALEQKQWEPAQEILDTAKKRWQVWKEGKDQWLAQVDYLDKLFSILHEKIDPGKSFEQAIQSRLDEAERNVSLLDSPTEFRELLEEFHQYINQYLEGKHLWEQLNLLTNEVSSQSYDSWTLRSIGYLNQLNQLLPASRESFEKSYIAWKEDLENALEEIYKEIDSKVPEGDEDGQEAQPVPRINARALANNQVEELVQMPSSPAVVQEFRERQVIRANKRIHLWKIGAYLCSLVLLTWMGFEQLYGSKPTFGSKPSEDYLILVAWGFSLEVSRDSVVKVMQSLGIGGQE